MRVTKKTFLILILSIVFSCVEKGNEKRYEDYDEDDFVEVQGIITKVTLTPIIRLKHFDINVYYEYNLDSDAPKEGKELDLDVRFFGKVGDPAIILVHKENENISFFGRRGILPKGEEVFKKYQRKSLNLKK